jgi:type VI secretion system secreted protein VgrG
VPWAVRHVDMRGGLSEAYQLKLDLLVDRGVELTAASMLGCDCELTVDRDGLARNICGVVLGVEVLDPTDDQQCIRVLVVPALRLLEQREDSRLWQGLSILAVAKQVLTEGLAVYGRELDASHLVCHYETREYIVQYRESDLAFASRLLERAGISYHFDHERSSGREVLVLEDSNDHWPQLVTLDDEPILPLITDRPDEAEIESVQHVACTTAIRPGAVVHRTFDWLRPSEPIMERSQDPGTEGHVRELYRHGRDVEVDPAGQARLELSRARADSHVVLVTGNAIGLAPGHRFRVRPGDRPGLDIELLVVRQHVRGDCPDAQIGESIGDAEHAVEVECVAFDEGAPWRPPLRAAVPKIHGPQTALVTGPEGEEIHTDAHGRIKVRFDWDRQHGLRDDTSMWIRVAQFWSGAGFGALFIPRIGTEVVVEFINGDPEQPLVTGCVYNPETASSIALPDAKTQSTIRTSSSPGGDGYNELRFEDAAGGEQIFIHAQRDLDDHIGRNHTTKIGHDRTQTVGGDHRQTIRGRQVLIVEGTQTERVACDAELTYEATRITRVRADEELHVDGLTTTIHGRSCKRSITGNDEKVVYGRELDPALSRTKVDGDIETEAARDFTMSVGQKLVLAQGLPAARGQLTFSDGNIEQQSERGWEVSSGEQTKISAGTVLALGAADRAELRQNEAAISIEQDRIRIEGKAIELVVGDNTLVITETGIKMLSRAVEMAAKAEVIVRGSNVLFD